MNKLETLKHELEGRITWLEQRIKAADLPDSITTYLLTRRHTINQILTRIEELERM